MKTIIIFIIVFFSIGFAQLQSTKIDSLKTVSHDLSIEINSLKDELETIREENKEFVINGNITSVTDNGEIELWGSAIPVDLNTLTPGFISRGFIVVLNPSKKNAYLDMYVNAYHYYKGEIKGIKYFGDLPSKVKDVINGKENKIKLLTDEFVNIDKNIFNLKGEESLQNAERLYTETKYFESIDELKNTKKFSYEEQIINQLLYKNYVELIKESQVTKNYKNIFALIDTVIEIPSLSEEQYQQLKTVHFTLCIYLADSCYQNKQFDESITYYDNAEKYGFSLSDAQKERIANIYFDQGEEQLKLNNIAKARMRYISAIYFNKKLSGIIHEHLNNRKESKFFYTSLSVILPGMGLVAQGEGSGWTFFCVSTLSAVAAYSLNKEAINEGHKNIIYNPGAIDERNNDIKLRNFSLLVFAISYAWGIVNTVNGINEYNRKYDLSFGIETKTVNFAMRFNF